jgi:hypothetical protein
MGSVKGMSIFMLFITFAATVSADQAGNIQETGSFDWLEGTWQNLRTGSYEQWFFDRESEEWVGMGFRIIDSDTIITKRLTITCNADICEYIAVVPHNPGPVSFRITVISETGFKSENPDHDFPKFIYYDLISPERIDATIGAGERKIVFQFKKE